MTDSEALNKVIENSGLKLTFIARALNKVAYGDDTQICDMILRKRYTREGENPHVIVTVSNTE